jgi:hypothetical protein
MQSDKTATEVKALTLQRNARDNYNQLMLSDAMKRQMMLWHTMNQKLLFSEEEKKPFVIRIAGRDALKYFKEKGLGDNILPGEAVDYMKQMSEVLGVSPEDLQSSGIDVNKMTLPKYPINKSEKKGQYNLVNKLELNEGEDSGRLYIEPEDIKGMFDFSVDVQSMTVNADEERRQARQTAVSLLVSNPNIIALLQQEGVKPKFKELFISWLDDLGFSDAERYFEQAATPGGPPGAGAGGGESIQELLKMFGGGKLNQGQNGGAPGGETNPTGPGVGANQLARVSTPGQGQTEPSVGQPNQEMLNNIMDKYGSQTNPTG